MIPLLECTKHIFTAPQQIYFPLPSHPSSEEMRYASTIYTNMRIQYALKTNTKYDLHFYSVLIESKNNVCWILYRVI